MKQEHANLLFRDTKKPSSYWTGCNIDSVWVLENLSGLSPSCPKHLIGPLSANPAYQVTRQTQWPCWSKMSANTTLLQLGLITRTILGNTGRVQGSCVRVGGVREVWEVVWEQTDSSTLLHSGWWEDGRPCGSCHNGWQLAQNGLFTEIWNRLCCPLSDPHWPRHQEPYFAKQPKDRQQQIPNSTILISFPLHKDPLYWSGVQKTMAMTM